MSITREEFAAGYAARSKISVTDLREKYRMVPKPCSCGELGCEGWQMFHGRDVCDSCLADDACVGSPWCHCMCHVAV